MMMTIEQQFTQFFAETGNELCQRFTQFFADTGLDKNDREEDYWFDTMEQFATQLSDEEKTNIINQLGGDETARTTVQGWGDFTDEAVNTTDGIIFCILQSGDYSVDDYE